MSFIIATAHFLGSIIALVLFWGASLWLAAWEEEKNRSRRANEIALNLGVSVNQLDDSAIQPRLLQHLSDRFSSELLRNRLSDFAGAVRTGWMWLASLLEIGVMIAVAWGTFTDRSDNAVYAWIVLGIAVFFSLSSIVFSLVCYLLTGRYPGEAKQGRKAAAEFLNSTTRV